MNTSDDKSILRFGSSQDELARYFDQLIFINVDFLNRAIVGRLIGLSDSYLTIERKDGRIMKIRRKSICAIEPLKQAGGVV